MNQHDSGLISLIYFCIAVCDVLVLIGLIVMTMALWPTYQLVTLVPIAACIVGTVSLNIALLRSVNRI